MSKIKKVSVSKSESVFEVPGAKFEMAACSYEMCHAQCGNCPYADQGTQGGLADYYYGTHAHIW